VSTVTRLRTRPGFDSRQGYGRDIFSATASRLVQSPIQPPVQWVPGLFTSVVKLPRRGADHSPPSSSEVKNAWRHGSTPQWRRI
jgi:hypothetical protein